VLLDVAGEDRVASITSLVEAIEGVRVIACSVPETEAEIIPCAEAGVAACLPRNMPRGDLVSTIELVASGESSASPRVAAMLHRHVAELAAQSSRELEVNLTAREQGILGLIDEGLSNKQIARALSIGLPTVRTTSTTSSRSCTSTAATRPPPVCGRGTARPAEELVPLAPKD
jgi:two-component system, NarL family, nitrate/nitrite response regulator NarL